MSRSSEKETLNSFTTKAKNSLLANISKTASNSLIPTSSLIHATTEETNQANPSNNSNPHPTPVSTSTQEVETKKETKKREAKPTPPQQQNSKEEKVEEKEDSWDLDKEEKFEEKEDTWDLDTKETTTMPETTKETKEREVKPAPNKDISNKQPQYKLSEKYPHIRSIQDITIQHFEITEEKGNSIEEFLKTDIIFSKKRPWISKISGMLAQEINKMPQEKLKDFKAYIFHQILQLFSDCKHPLALKTIMELLMGMSILKHIQLNFNISASYINTQNNLRKELTAFHILTRNNPRIILELLAYKTRLLAKGTSQNTFQFDLKLAAEHMAVEYNGRIIHGNFWLPLIVYKRLDIIKSLLTTIINGRPLYQHLVPSSRKETRGVEQNALTLARVVGNKQAIELLMPHFENRLSRLSRSASNIFSSRSSSPSPTPAPLPQTQQQIEAPPPRQEMTSEATEAAAPASAAVDAGEINPETQSICCCLPS